MKKVRKQAGFTLAELLIVVAIIAILVAIGIPMFNTAMEKSRETADISNLRAAKAAGAVLHMDGMTLPYKENEDDDDDDEKPAKKIPSCGYACFYDISQGILLDTEDYRVGTDADPKLKPAGKGTKVAGTQPKTEVLMTDGTNDYTPESNVSNGYIAVLITPDNSESPVQVTFVEKIDNVEKGSVSGSTVTPAAFKKSAVTAPNNMLNSGN